MSHICIRRTKEMQNEKGEYLVPLPPVEMTLVPVKLDEVTKVRSDDLEKLSNFYRPFSIRNYTMKLRRSLNKDLLQ